MANDAKMVRTALARAIAERNVPDDVIELAAKQLAVSEYPIRGINVCTVGVCLDYVIDAKDWVKALPGLIEIRDGKLEKIEVFPLGMIDPDLLHVKVTQDLDLIPRLGVQR